MFASPLPPATLPHGHHENPCSSSLWYNKRACAFEVTTGQSPALMSFSRGLGSEHPASLVSPAVTGTALSWRTESPLKGGGRTSPICDSPAPSCHGDGTQRCLPTGFGEQIVAPSRYAIYTALCCTDSSPKTASHRIPCPWEDRKVSLEPRHKAYFAYRLTTPTGETREGLSASKGIPRLCQRVAMYHRTPGAQQRPGANQKEYKPGGVRLTPTTHVSCRKKAHSPPRVSLDWAAAPTLLTAPVLAPHTPGLEAVVTGHKAKHPCDTAGEPMPSWTKHQHRGCESSGILVRDLGLSLWE